MKVVVLFLVTLLTSHLTWAQSLSHTDVIDLLSCPNFDCFESNVLSKDITLKEKPYNDAFGGKHQIIFNADYEEPNVKVYSVGITFKGELTTIFLRSKSKEYQIGLLGALSEWGKFESASLNQTDGAITFSTFKSMNFPDCSLRTEVFYDKDDKTNYYVLKLTQPTKTAKAADKAGSVATEPAIEVKTKTHTLRVYSGWSDIFKNPENMVGLRSDYGSKKPSEVFKEGPDGWLKSAPYLYSLNIKFEEVDSFTLESTKKSFIDLAIRRTGWTKDKIKLVEEKVTLPDGRNGIVLFYVCPALKGMVSGNFLDCVLSIESSANKIISYTIFMDGGCPDLPEQEAVAWKDYFKEILLSIRPN